MYKKLKKNLTINDFEIVKDSDKHPSHITWANLEKVFGKRRYKEFCKWMSGQTCVQEGAYPCDVENFLRPAHKRFFD